MQPSLRWEKRPKKTNAFDFGGSRNWSPVLRSCRANSCVEIGRISPSELDVRLPLPRFLEPRQAFDRLNYEAVVAKGGQSSVVPIFRFGTQKTSRPPIRAVKNRTVRPGVNEPIFVLR